VERLAVIAQQDVNAPTPGNVISALVTAAFSTTAKTAQLDLQGVVQTEIADRLMILAANPDATSEVRSAALWGVHETEKAIQKSAPTPALRSLDHEIKLFLENPQQNIPKLKSSGAPPGPPV
jgi:hypothetical protein